MGGGTLEIGERFTLPNGSLHHEVHPLAGALDQTALAQDLGESAVARVLLVENVFRRDARREATGAHNFEAAWKLAHENGTPEPVVTMGDRIEQGLANGSFVKGGNIVAKESILITLAVVAQIDLLPEAVVNGKEAFPELDALLRRT